MFPVLRAIFGQFRPSGELKYSLEAPPINNGGLWFWGPEARGG